MHAFKVMDSHTGGNPTRLVFSGIPPLPGETVAAKMHAFRDRHDWIRTALTLEPRGGNLTSSAVLVPPCDPRADVGVFFMEAMGYLPMCGSDTIGLVTMLVDSGQIPSTGEATVVRLDTPAGLVEATAHRCDGRVDRVTFVNVPAFVAVLGASIRTESFGTVSVDVAYGGNFHAIVSAADLGVELAADRTGPAVAAAREVLAATNAALPVQHPDNPDIAAVTHVLLVGPAQGDGADARIMVVIPPGIVDRSPCGTGTTARMATLLARGERQVGDELTHESVTGATFTAHALELVGVGAVDGYRVAITGSAYVTADATVYVDPRDPLGHGFLLS